jgi:hypothetical protein
MISIGRRDSHQCPHILRDGVGQIDVLECQRDLLEIHLILALSRNFTLVIFDFNELSEKICALFPVWEVELRHEH